MIDLKIENLSNICVTKKLEIVELNNENIIKGISFFMGNYEPLYGHCLLDSFSRAWALVENKNLLAQIDTFVFADIRRVGSANINVNLEKRNSNIVSSAFKTFLKVFDPKQEKKIILLRIPTKFEKLVVPKPALIGQIKPSMKITLNKLVHENMRKVFSSIRDFYCDRTSNTFSKKIYISRFKHTSAQIRKEKVLPGNAGHASPFVRHCENEQDVEKYFRALGFQVVYLEEMSVEQQIKLFSNSKCVAGFGGTGLHNIIFSFPGLTLINLGDVRWKNATSEPNINQKAINFLVENLVQFYVPTKFTTISKTVHKVEISSIDSFLKTQNFFQQTLFDK